MKKDNIFLREGKVNILSEKEQLLIHEPEQVYYIEEGSVLLFLALLDREGIPGFRRFIAEFSEGELLCGEESFISGKGKEALLVVGREDGAKLRSLPSSALIKANQSAEVTDILQGIKLWLEKTGTEQKAELFLQHPGEITGNLSARWEQERLEEERRLLLKGKTEKKGFSQSLSGLAKSGGQGKQHRPVAGSEDLLLETCRLLGKRMNILMKAPESKELLRGLAGVEEIARASKIRVRRVKLEEGWYKEDSGPLLGFLKEGNTPVALIPEVPGSYELYDLENGHSKRVTKETAGELARDGYMFYRSFPAEKITLRKMFKFAIEGIWRRDLLQLILMGALGGALGIAVPVATGIVFDTIIPEANRGDLLQIAFFLFAVAFSSMIFQFLRLLATLRMEGKIDGSLQAALWDRLISLPVAFFRKYSSGELAMRAMGISQIRQMLSGATLDALLNGIFSIFNLFLLFYYNQRLAGYATALVMIALLISVTFGYRQVGYERQAQEQSNRLSGLLLQMIGAISKFQIAGAEKRAFRNWAEHSSKHRYYNYKKQTVANMLHTFHSFFPVLATMTVFYFYEKTQGGLASGQFVAFIAAFTSLLLSVVNMTEALTGAGGIIPLYQRAIPILETLPEDDDSKLYPQPLKGNIEVNHVSFRYKQEEPLVIRDLSLQIHQGEYVAFVGASGCGKSTLLRILLGFEQPESGRVYYDGQDLSKIDSRGVRKQLGVVLQNGELISGSFMDNIIGTNPMLTIEDAWEAARIAGIDDEIRELPMGMHTRISEGSSTISGGQKQRLMIARAVANKPRILYFDEATSALDNRTQAAVSKSLAELKSTRIVIAHRISTVMDCDRIFVMEQGRIVEEGSFNKLMDQGGVFAELAKRQMA